MASIKELLWRSTTRLLTLLGPPGIGKTSLGIAVASAMQADFKDGLVFVSLGPVSDPSLVAATLAEALGMRETAARSLLHSLQDSLSDKQMFLILDNFEHVISAAPLIADLLATAPQLKVIITSRSPLHIRGEKLVEVPLLDMPDPEHMPPLEELEHISSVALFVERVRDVNSDFALTPENAKVVTAICTRLAGLPLAIELAAATTRLLSLPALLSRLERQLTVLAAVLVTLRPSIRHYETRWRRATGSWGLASRGCSDDWAYSLGLSPLRRQRGWQEQPLIRWKRSWIRAYCEAACQ